MNRFRRLRVNGSIQTEILSKWYFRKCIQLRKLVQIINQIKASWNRSGSFPTSPCWIFITFLKIIDNFHHLFGSRIPALDIPQRNTRQTVNQNDKCFVVGRCSTEQFSHKFVPYSVRVWNSLPNEIVNASNIDIFKLKSNKFLIQNLWFWFFIYAFLFPQLILTPIGSLDL